MISNVSLHAYFKNHIWSSKNHPAWGHKLALLYLVPGSFMVQWMGSNSLELSLSILTN